MLTPITPLLDSSRSLGCRLTPGYTHLEGGWGSPSCPGCPRAVPQGGWGPPWPLGHPGPRRGEQPRPPPRLLPAVPSGSGPSVPSQKTPPGMGGFSQHRGVLPIHPPHPPPASPIHPTCRYGGNMSSNLLFFLPRRFFFSSPSPEPGSRPASAGTSPGVPATAPQE